MQVGSQQRSTSQFRFACELVRSGRIGQVRRVEIGLPIDPTAPMIRVSRFQVTWDPRTERFVNDIQADALLMRKERSPYGIQHLPAADKWQPTCPGVGARAGGGNMITVRPFIV